MSNTNKKKYNSKIKIIPLGGLGEIGKNMMCVEYLNQILIIDCGMKMPDDEMFGIDLVIPDMSYLIENKERIAGILITHGHEDHIGAIPYLFKNVSNIPIYGGKLALELIKNKMDEHDISSKAYEMIVISPRETINIGDFAVEFIRITHSIADSYAIAITTKIGTIIHSGDFKIDYRPIDGNNFDFYRLAYYGEKGVLLLLSDSTNIEREGFSPSESELKDKFRKAITNNKGRTLVATFSSNIHRIQQVIEIAVELGKKVALSGKSMEKIVNISLQLGFIRIPMGVLIGLNEINDYPRNQVIVFTTGSQGEPMAALSLLARESHKWLDLHEDDTVILSASVIPGNEKTVSRILNTLFKTGATIIYREFGDIHVSGHGFKEEIKLLMSLVKPKMFIPIHGEFRHLVHHAALAEDMGIEGKNIIIAQDGDIINVTDDKIEKIDNLELQSVFVDGKGVGDIGTRVLRDRQTLSEDGVVVVLLAIIDNKLYNKPEVISRGFVYVKENTDMIEEAKDIVEKEVNESLKNGKDILLNGKIDFSSLKARIKGDLRTYFFSKVERRPMIMVRIIEV